MRAPPLTGSPRILVTGADGQLGRSLRALTGQDSAAPPCFFVTRAQLDICDEAALTRWLDTHPVDCLINAAAYTAVDRAAGESDKALAINAQAPGLLARHCAARGIRLLHVSTDYVFDGALERPYRETDVPAPLNTYGRSKWLGEQAIRQAAPDALIIRTSWIFSAWGGNFVRTVLRLGAQQDHLRVIDDQIGGPTWAGHLALVLLRLARQPAIAGGVYHFAGHPWVSWHGFAGEIFAQALERGLITRLPVLETIRSQDWPSPEPRPANSRLDGTKLETALGALECDWRQGLDQVLNHWQQEPSA